MPFPIQFSASMQCAPPLDLRTSALDLVKASIDMLHIDLMDGLFVPNLALNFDQLAALSDLTNIPIDAHLMMSNPERYLDRAIDAGASWVCFHVETSGEISTMLKHIHERGAHAGLAISPSTPVNALLPYLQWTDYLVVMAVNPGFSGQSFLPETLSRLDTLSAYQIPLMVDGGIDMNSAIESVRHGASLLVAGAKCIFLPGLDLTDTTRNFTRRVKEELLR